ncbi:MAG: dienelactone hydrolase family protein [Candidatus Rokuibacteriota bacterium]
MAKMLTGSVSRRGFLVTSGTFAGYAMGVEKVLAQAIKTDMTGLVAGDQEVRIGDYTMPVYEARPATGTGYPIVLVISEIWGVHEYIRDCTRRFAKAGFCAVAPELFKREGGVGHLTDIQAILKIVGAQKREQTLGDIKAAVDWAKKRPSARADRVGVTGWCWGGSTTIQVAATNPDMKAAVAWYGPVARAYQGAAGPVTGFDLVKEIKAPFMGLFGELDQNPKPEDVKKFEELLKQTNKNVEIVIYPGANHGFYADYRPSYNKAAADDAWGKCTGWFDKYLKA